MDLWSWICELPNSDAWTDPFSPLIYQLAISKPSLLNKNTTQSIQLKAERAFESDLDSTVITFSVCYDEKTLWVSDTCPLSSEKPFLPLVIQLLQEIVSRSPAGHDITCPRSQLKKLKPDPVSWILDTHSPESISTFFNLVFLTRLFWVCVCDAPSEVGSLYFSCLLAPNLEAFSCKHAPVLRAFFISVGTDVELCFVRTFGYMLAKWLILKEVGVGLQLLSPLSSHTLGFSYATESHGLWVLKGYAPVLAMTRTRFNGPRNQYPVIESKESVLRYALAHQQLEAVIQLEYTVGFSEGFIQVNTRVNNLRLHVAKLGFNKNSDEVYGDEKHFPSRIRVWVGPEAGASYVAGLTLGRSTKNVEREKEIQKVWKGNFGKLKIPRVKATAKITAKTRTKNWRWDQDAEGNVSIFDGILCDNSTGVEVATWNPSSGGGDHHQLESSFRKRYTGANRSFTKSGGLVFAGDECGGEGVGWRLKKEMEGSVLRWRIGGQVWLSYCPNEIKSSYFETRCVEWCDAASIHFLQSLVVSPRIVYSNFAPELCRCIYFLSVGSKRACFFEDDEVNEEMRRVAKRHKAWLTYHRVMAYGETSQQHHCGGDIDSFEKNSQCFTNVNSRSIDPSDPNDRAQSSRAYHNFEKVHPHDHEENATDDIVEEAIQFTGIQEFREPRKALTSLDIFSGKDVEKSSNIKCLQVQDILKEYQSDTPTSLNSRNSDFEEESSSEECANEYKSSERTLRMNADDPRPQISNKNQQARGHSMHNEANITKFFTGRSTTSSKDLDSFESHTLWNGHLEQENTHGSLLERDFQYFDHTESMNLQNYQFQKNPNEVSLRFQENGILEKVISKLCFSEDLGQSEEDYTVKITTIYEMLMNRKGPKYSLLKDVILDQLLMAISTSKEDGIIRASVSVLSTIISLNKSVIEEIQQKGLLLLDLASALKRNVHEAAILIYLINPTPSEIRTLELLPILVEVICTSNSYKSGPIPVLLTPPAASLMIIEVLVTAFDSATNNTHLAVISSPRVLCGILNVPTNNSMEEVISLASVLVRCMQFDGECRTYLSQCTPVGPFISLLISNQKRAKFVALEFFHEILCIPRSSAITLLHQIKETGNINNICVLVLLMEQSQPEQKLLAASLLLQLDMLGNSSANTIYREEAVEALLESLTCEDNAAAQQLSAFILSNLGGTYAWTGEPYTIPWLLKKAGLTSLHYKNMIRNVDWLDQSLQDAGIDTWSVKIARQIIKFGNPVFIALEKGLKSKTKRVSRDCLTAIAWLGCEIVKSPNDMRHSACEILLGTIEGYLHPGLELEERLLACLCIYNYASGRGMQKLIHFSEGVRESLRRLSNITWMAEELLKVADYFQPDKWRISCVHTQILEVGLKNSGAVSALIYYRGQLYSGYADGSIKVWDVKGMTATLVWDMKEHRKAVTCFSLFEPGNCLLSGSADKTIRIWQMVHRKLECIEVIAAKEPIQSIDTSGELIFANTQSHKLKVFDASRKVKDFCKNKNVKCIRVTQGKVYIGCTDSSIQELAITSNRQLEIKAPTKSWMTQNKSINSITLYKDWLYSASAVVEGSRIREWRRNSKPQISIMPEKRGNVVAMRVVEDFIYLLCSSSANNLQIWLRGTHHKVGRLTGGNKITSLLTANDMILCGTETGVIKGWIPL